MSVVYLDFETYYDKDYSLSKLSMEEYIRDKKFEPQILGVAGDNMPVHIVPADKIPAALKLLKLDSPSTITVIQNALFDGFIIEDYYKMHVANPICTRMMMRWMGASRLTRESLKAQCEFFETTAKGSFLESGSMLGKRVKDLTPEEYQSYAEYCAQDVSSMRENFLKMLPYMTPDAMKFIAMTVKMYTQPVFHLDKERLASYYDELVEKQEADREKLQHMFQFENREDFLKALRSKAKFCTMLEQLGGVVPMKVSEKKSKTAGHEVLEPALAKSDIPFIELMNSEDENISLLARTRAANNSSISMSRCETFQAIAERGTLPVHLEAYLANTGRYSAGTSDGVKSDKTNLQNLSKRGDDKTLRKCVKPPKGYALVACDSSQIEARVLAYAACQEDLVQDFRNGVDPYCSMASVAYSESYYTIYEWTKGAKAHDENSDPELKKIYKNYRNIGKTCILQLGYSAGADNFSDYLLKNNTKLMPTVEAHHEEATRLVGVYRNKHFNIVNFWGTCNNVLRALVMGGNGSFGGPKQDLFVYRSDISVAGHRVPGIILPDGYRILYPNLRIEYNEERKKNVYVFDATAHGKSFPKIIHRGLCCNNCIQGLAFALMRWQALMINERYPIRINIHDSWGVVVPESEAEEAKAYMLACMKTLPTWAEGLPIDAEAEIGHDFTVA